MQWPSAVDLEFARASGGRVDPAAGLIVPGRAAAAGF